MHLNHLGRVAIIYKIGKWDISNAKNASLNKSHLNNGINKIMQINAIKFVLIMQNKMEKNT